MNTHGSTNTVARAMNDMGLAAWFGGSLMGAVGLNPAADSTGRSAAVAEAGWRRWTAVNAVAIGSAAIGGLMLTKDNKARIAGQAGVGSVAATKALLLGAAGAASLYARMLGRRIAHANQDGTPVAGTTEPTNATPPEVGRAQRQLKLMQWVVPALTGATIVVDSRLSEQQRPVEVVRGTLRRLNPAA
jgi:hypothetical protein